MLLHVTANRTYVATSALQLLLPLRKKGALAQAANAGAHDTDSCGTQALSYRL